LLSAKKANSKHVSVFGKGRRNWKWQAKKVEASGSVLKLLETMKGQKTKKNNQPLKSPSSLEAETSAMIKLSLQ